MSFSMSYSMSYSMSHSMPGGCGMTELLQIAQASNQAAEQSLTSLLEAGAGYNDGSLSKEAVAASFLVGTKKDPLIAEMYAGWEDGDFIGWFQERYFGDLSMPPGALPYVYTSVDGARSPCEVPADAPDQIPLVTPEGSLGTCTYREFMFVDEESNIGTVFRNSEYDLGARPWWVDFQGAPTGEARWTSPFTSSTSGRVYFTACMRLTDGVACRDFDEDGFLAQMEQADFASACCDGYVVYAFFLSPEGDVNGNLLITTVPPPEGAWVSAETGLPIKVTESGDPVIRATAAALAGSAPGEELFVIVDGVEYAVHATTATSLGGVGFPGGSETTAIFVLATPTKC